MDGPQPFAKPSPHTASLNISYRGHSRTPSASNARRPSNRLPLRVVDDNSPLPPSAYASSENKSAKELGAQDYFYTTAPTGYQHGGHQQVPRPRRYPVDSAYAGRLKNTAYSDEPQGYEKRNVRSYRDTTSEIISLYAASNPQAYVQLASPGPTDASRAYSMSAAYARQFNSQRPPSSIQKSASAGGLQRSRSPAPYPARLRRPGVRALSPAVTEDRVVDYARLADVNRSSQKPLQAPYKSMYSHGTRRPPPLALRPDMNRSTNSLPSGPSPGPSHYGTASGRARTPSSSVSWASRPSDRYYAGSTDPSIRSASLTSIVEMYQRPMTATGNCPPVRPSGMVYYDYSEEFKKQAQSIGVDIDTPVCPIPRRAGHNGQAMILREESQSRLDAAANSSNNPDIAPMVVPSSRSGDLNSIDESCDSYIEDSHEDSIKEIEKVLANAISNVAADQNLMNTLRATDARYSQRLLASANMHAARLRDRSEGGASSSANDWAIPQKAWRQSKTIATEPSYAVRHSSNRASQTSLCKKDFALDPVFADFTSLLSSFERLAKSPFSRLSDEDDDEESKHLSRQLTLELLDRVSAETKTFQRRHRRNRITQEIGLLEQTEDDSAASHPLSSEDTLVLAPEPLSPTRQPATKNGQELKLMKALPLLPKERLSSSFPENEQETGATEQAVSPLPLKPEGNGNGSQSPKSSKSPLTNKPSHYQNPSKLKLRVNASRSSTDGDAPTEVGPVQSQRSSMDDGRVTTKPPPRLKLKLSRTQLNQGQSAQSGTIIRNNRLKQCNALADVAPSPRSCKAYHALADKEPSTDEGSHLRDGTLEAIEDEARRRSSGHVSDQFNLAYPPTPPETVDNGFHSSSSTRKLVKELPTSRSDVDRMPSRRLRSKFSFLRPRTTAAVEAESTTNEMDGAASLEGEKRAASMDGQHHASGKSAIAASTSAKSERVGVKMKRWATDAKRAVRSYVRRTLVRAPKKANQDCKDVST